MRRLSSEKVATARKTLSVRVPVTICHRGGRKRVLTPDGSPLPNVTGRKLAAHSTILKALARAFRWRKLLENGTYATIEDMAAAERINTSYISRILRLTLLAPQIIEEILENHNSDDWSQILKPLPLRWRDQEARLCGQEITGQ